MKIKEVFETDTFKGVKFKAKKMKHPTDKKPMWYVVDSKDEKPYAGPYTTKAEAEIHAEGLPSLLK